MKRKNNYYVVNLYHAPEYYNSKNRTVRKEFSSADEAMKFCDRVYNGTKPGQENLPGSLLVAMHKRNPWYSVHVMKVSNATNVNKLMTVEDLLYINITR